MNGRFWGHVLSTCLFKVRVLKSPVRRLTASRRRDGRAELLLGNLLLCKKDLSRADPIRSEPSERYESLSICADYTCLRKDSSVCRRAFCFWSSLSVTHAPLTMATKCDDSKVLWQLSLAHFTTCSVHLETDTRLLVSVLARPRYRRVLAEDYVSCVRAREP